jgi:NAD+ synthase
MDQRIISKKIEDFIKRKARGFSGIVVGLSGGVDSSVVAQLCANAIGKDRILVLIMPYEWNENMDDAVSFAEQLGIKYEIVEIKDIADSFEKKGFFGKKISKENLLSRVRMCLLYGVANERNMLVAGTSNKSEIMVGYFTKYGDGGADFEPIGDLYKTDVWELAKFLGIPLRIVEKKPSADLSQGQTDEGDLGITYYDLDDALRKKLFHGRVGELIARSAHKRAMPDIACVSRTGLFIGRFQPFHIGHLDALGQIAKEVDEIIVGIGSAQYNNTKENPFSYAEREMMIKAGLKSLKKPFVVVRIDDTHDDRRWAGYVVLHCPRFDVVYTGNELVERLFMEKGFVVKRPLIKHEISATEIRRMMKTGEKWQRFVPAVVRDVLKKIGGVKRVKGVK